MICQHFSGADFTETNFSNSLFMQTDLSNADLTEANNYNIDIRFNEVKKAKFSRYEALRLLDLLDIELVD